MPKSHSLEILKVRCTIHSNEFGEVISAEGQLPTDDHQLIDSSTVFESRRPRCGKTLGVKFRVFRRPEWMSDVQAQEVAEIMKGIDGSSFPVDVPNKED